MATFKDLSPQALSLLEFHVAFWSVFDDKIDDSLTIDHQFTVDAQGCGPYIAQYAIVYAVLLDDKELTQELCRLGANLKVTDCFNHNKTPLEIAIEYGRAGVADILIKHGAQLPKDVKIPSNNPCLNPFGFFWSIKEKAFNREVDYNEMHNLLHPGKTS